MDCLLLHLVSYQKTLPADSGLGGTLGAAIAHRPVLGISLWKEA